MQFQPQAPPPPEFLLFWLQFEDGARSHSTFRKPETALMYAWHEYEENGRRSVLCVLRENGQKLQHPLDHAHRQVGPPQPL